MRKIVVLGVVALLALAGCAPNTDAAYKNCYETLGLTWQLDDTLTSDEKIDKMIEIAELCSDLAEAAPERFNEEWGQ